MKRKGILMAGGSGTRLFPATRVITKHLLPVYDKPMVYYPLSTLMLAGIQDVLIISTPNDIPRYADLLGDGSQWGMNIEYAVQEAPNGLAEAFLIGEDFLDGSPCALILGDNIFYGHSLETLLLTASSQNQGATIFAYHVNDAQNYGVVEFDKEGKAIGIEEKPVKPRSNFAITGLYFYDREAVNYAKQVKPSSRNELEISDINRMYMDSQTLSVQILRRGYAWLDTGTQENLLKAHQFVHTLEDRQGLKISCPEEIAYRKKWIDKTDLKKLAEPMLNNSYGQYLVKLMEGQL